MIPEGRENVATYVPCYESLHWPYEDTPFKLHTYFMSQFSLPSLYPPVLLTRNIKCSRKWEEWFMEQFYGVKSS